MIACLHDCPTQSIVNGYTGISLQYLMLFCVYVLTFVTYSLMLVCVSNKC